MKSFGNYAVAQIKKAKGLNKKMNWEKNKVERKTPLDFCYVYNEGKTVPIDMWLFRKGMNQKCCGLVALDHFRDCYAMYYDDLGHNMMNLGFHGIALSDSNQVRTSSVPMGMNPLCVVSYNADGYVQHCKDYNEYQIWLENRNTQRYVDIKGHNQKIDGKNLLHCVRLIDIATEIATLKTINVRRPNADYLLSIRRGEVELQKIIDKAEADIAKMDSLYSNCDLPEDVDKDFVNKLLLEIRYLTEQT